MSATGLNLAQRKRTRNRIKAAAYEALKRKGSMTYTQNARARWDGIRHGRRAYKHEAPRSADCSALATWCIWDGVLRYLRNGTVRTDFVNGQNWLAGYTGTQQDHGRRVTGRKLVGDLVFYGPPGSRVANHVAIYVGNGLVVSFGSQGGPYLLRWDYRHVVETRRYIR